MGKTTFGLALVRGIFSQIQDLEKKERAPSLTPQLVCSYLYSYIMFVTVDYNLTDQLHPESPGIWLMDYSSRSWWWNLDLALVRLCVCIPRLSNVDNWIALFFFLFCFCIQLLLIWYISHLNINFICKGGLHYDPGVNKYMYHVFVFNWNKKVRIISIKRSSFHWLLN